MNPVEHELPGQQLSEAKPEQPAEKQTLKLKSTRLVNTLHALQAMFPDKDVEEIDQAALSAYGDLQTAVQLIKQQSEVPPCTNSALNSD